MDFRELSRKDLEPHIGSRPRVAEILKRRRRLTLEVARRLSKGLNLPADILIQPYDTVPTIAPEPPSATTA